MMQTAHSSETNSVRLVAVASFIGTTIEWYDFFLYGTAAAPVFHRPFFPPLLPPVAPAVGPPPRLGPIRGRFLGAAGRRHRHRTLRRQDRPQVDARAHARRHGRGDVPDRPASHLPTDRALGCSRPRPAARRAGIRRR